MDSASCLWFRIGNEDARIVGLFGLGGDSVLCSSIGLNSQPMLLIPLLYWTNWLDELYSCCHFQLRDEDERSINDK